MLRKKWWLADKTKLLQYKQRKIQLFHNSIIKTYKNLTKQQKIKISLIESSSVMTLTHHKTNFENNSTKRLINTAKNEIGRITKVILESSKTLQNWIQLQQRNNTTVVIKWFKIIEKQRQKANIHKPGVPIRPIVLYCGSPLDNLNKYIANILKAPSWK